MAGKNNNPTKPKNGGRPVGRKALYNYASKYAYEAIDELVDQMRNARQSAVRTGAAKALLNKCLPDLKAMELSGDEENPLTMYAQLSDEQLNRIIESKARKLGIVDALTRKRE